ncbi:MAG: glycoside hydrolase family 9 protein [Chitinispirillia bacterium]|nr:glycoside hydrolase family 9 protein [Chitinispirillia bacterium]
MTRRIAVIIALICVLSPAALTAQTSAQGAFTPDQYKKALWMLTRFYGAQRSGHGPNWMFMEYTHTKSYVRDSLDGRDLVGGWFDCGDHSKFGQPFFYTTYVLAKAYDVFPTGFHDLYRGDYSDYMAATGSDEVRWSIVSGRPNGIPDLLEELKYATDWIIKATPAVDTFYFQKGQGREHSRWVTAGFNSTLPYAAGGEADRVRDIFRNPNCRVMPSFAAATLAVMSRIYRKYDPAYADLCLSRARNAYAYASARGSAASAGSSGGGFYPAMGGNKVPLVYHIASAEMFAATGETAFRSGMRNEATDFHNWGFDYDNPHDLAAYISATMHTAPAAHLQNMRTRFVEPYTRQTNSEGINTHGGGWGALRYVGNHAFTTALFASAANTAEFDQFIYNQIDYILGKNSRNFSFLIGFNDRGPGMSASGGMASKPHHRNVYLSDDDDDWNWPLISSRNIPPRNKYFGFLVGGSRNPADYRDDIQHFQSTEGGLDYQAGLIGALAYIVSKLAPADTASFGQPPVLSTPTTLQISTSSDPAETAAFISDTLRIVPVPDLPVIPITLYAHIFDQNGKIITGIDCETITWGNSTYASGLPVTGCSYVLHSFELTPTITIHVFAGANRPSIHKSIAVTDGTVSVKHRNTMMAKYGFSMNIRRDAVTFTAGQNRTISEINIYNLAGKKVFSQKRSAPSAQIKWNTAAAPKGMYLAQVKLNNGAVVQRNVMLR